MLNITIWSSRVFWLNLRLFWRNFYEKQRVDCEKSIDFVPSINTVFFNYKKTRVLTQKFMQEKICGTTFNMYWHVFSITFVNLLFKWKKLNLNPYHYKLKFISASNQKYNSKFQEFGTVRNLKIQKNDQRTKKIFFK